jgi:hypothetical protein
VLSFIYINRKLLFAATIAIADAHSDHSTYIIPVSEHAVHSTTELHHSYVVFDSLFALFNIPDVLPFSEAQEAEKLQQLLDPTDEELELADFARWIAPVGDKLVLAVHDSQGTSRGKRKRRGTGASDEIDQSTLT